MMDEEIQEQINQFRMTAEMMGDTALEAISKGDAGMARTAARQAAQYARLAVQLETGEMPGAESNRDRRDENRIIV
jgi:phage shock protein A